MWQAPDIHDVATEVSQCLSKADTSSAFRVIVRFLEFYDKADRPSRESMCKGNEVVDYRLSMKN